MNRRKGYNVDAKEFVIKLILELDGEMVELVHTLRAPSKEDWMALERDIAKAQSRIERNGGSTSPMEAAGAMYDSLIKQVDGYIHHDGSLISIDEPNGLELIPITHKYAVIQQLSRLFRSFDQVAVSKN